MPIYEVELPNGRMAEIQVDSPDQIDAVIADFMGGNGMPEAAPEPQAPSPVGEALTKFDASQQPGFQDFLRQQVGGMMGAAGGLLNVGESLQRLIGIDAGTTGQDVAKVGKTIAPVQGTIGELVGEAAPALAIPGAGTALRGAALGATAGGLTPGTLEERAAGAGVGAVTGGVVPFAAKIAKIVGSALSPKAAFTRMADEAFEARPDLKEGYMRALEESRETGIPVDIAEALDSAPMRGIREQVTQVPGAADKLRAAQVLQINKALNQLQDLTAGGVDDLGGVGKQLLNRTETVINRVKAVRDGEFNKTLEAAERAAGNWKGIRLDGTRQLLQEILTDPFADKATTRAVKNLNALIEKRGALSVKEYQAVLKNAGEAAGKNKDFIPVAQALREDLGSAAGEGAHVQLLQAARQGYYERSTEMRQISSSIVGQYLKSKKLNKGTTMVNSLLKLSPAELDDALPMLRKYAPDTLRIVQGAAIRKALKDAGATLGPTATVDIGKFMKALPPATEKLLEGNANKGKILQAVNHLNQAAGMASTRVARGATQAAEQAGALAGGAAAGQLSPVFTASFLFKSMNPERYVALLTEKAGRDLVEAIAKSGGRGSLKPSTIAAAVAAGILPKGESNTGGGF